MTPCFAPVVAGVDGSPASAAVLDEAVAAAHRRLLPLRVIRTVPEADAPATVTAIRALEDLRGTLAGALPAAVVDLAVLPPAERRAVTSRVAGLRTGHPTVPVTLRRPQPDLAVALAVTSSDAALVVLGRAPDPAASGTETAIAVAGRSACPVLVLPASGSAPAPDRGAGRRTAVALRWTADAAEAGPRAGSRRQGRGR